MSALWRAANNAVMLLTTATGIDGQGPEIFPDVLKTLDKFDLHLIVFASTGTLEFPPGKMFGQIAHKNSLKFKGRKEETDLKASPKMVPGHERSYE